VIRSLLVSPRAPLALVVTPLGAALLALCIATPSAAQTVPGTESPTAQPTEPEPPATPPAIEAPAPSTAPAAPTLIVVPATPAIEPVPPPPAAASEVPPLVLPGPASDANRARLDYSDGSFYLRAFDDNLVFVPAARMHIDTYTFAGDGVGAYHRSNGTGLKTNLFFRRFVLELGGTVRKKWFYWLGGNFGPTQVDGSQAPDSTANVYDGFIGYMPVPTLRIYAGQFNAPFTMENVTSSRWLDLMERALIVRTVATPYNKAEGLLVWGETENKSFEYQAGVFGGDGMNRPNIDNAFDGMARLLVRPLASRSDALNRLHIGASARYGWRNYNFVRYDAPSLATPGGYTFWSSSSGDTHIKPYRGQLAIAGEVYVPFERFDVRGEFVYVNEGRREVSAVDADGKAVPASERGATLRSGALRGWGGYAQVSWWVCGSPRISGNPAGLYGVLKVPEGLGKQLPYALQLVLRGEMMRLNYDSNSRSGDLGTISAKTDNIFVNVYQAGLNYWATKHIRLSAEYSLYQFPGKPGQTNQAVAPGVKSKAAPDASVLHELSFRLGLAL